MEQIELLFGAGALLMASMFYLMILFILYVLTVYPMFKMYKLAGLKNPNFAFIPVVGGLKMYNLANLSSWAFLISLLVFIPVIGPVIALVFKIYVSVKICQNFGLNTFVCALSVFFSTFVYWYIALTNKPFVGTIDYQYREDIY